MKKPIIQEIDVSTGEVVEREMTKAEHDEYKKEQKATLETVVE